MRLTIWTVRAIGAAALTLSSPAAHAEARQDQQTGQDRVTAAARPAKPTDALDLQDIRNLRLSADGKWALFDLRAAVGDKSRRTTTTWLMNLDTRSTEKLEDDDYIWSPKGATLAFLKEVDEVPQIHIRSAASGSVRKVTDLKNGAGGMLWSPDGTRIAFSSSGHEGPTPEAAPPGIRIHTRPDYKGEFGYSSFSNRKAAIWVVDVGKPDAAPSRLTDGAQSSDLSFWAPDSTAVYLLTREVRGTDPYDRESTTSLHRVDVSTGAQALVHKLKTPGEDKDIGAAPEFKPSPDGKTLAFYMENPQAPETFAQTDIYLMDLKSGETRNLTAAYDREIGEGLTWAGNGKLLAMAEDNGTVSLMQVDAKTGKVAPWWDGERAIDAFSRAETNGRILAIASDPVTPVEIYDVTKRGTAVKLTDFNEGLRKSLDLTPPERIAYKGPGGETIHGFLQKPPAFDPTKKYPMIVWVHGGPYMAFTSKFEMDTQVMAAAGYLVMYVNPRGSSSYGQAFASALANNWPGDVDFGDVMAGVDYLSTRPYVDSERLAISGISAGGTMANWAIGHTNRFRAAVSISDIADLRMLWFIGDQPALRRAEDKKTPWSADDARSPIAYAMNAKTPTLFLVGNLDARTPAAAGAELMFRMLQYNRVPTALIEFEGAGHGITNFTTDWRHRAWRLHYTLRWLDLHLKGIPAPEFAIKPGE